ncbi:MAG: hypothetical protein ACK4GW_13535 [Pseudorhodobacter sp.]
MKRRPRIDVSDHAVLRYLERVGGFEIESLRAEIAARVSDAAAIGASGVVIDGFSYKIRPGAMGLVVTTVLPTGMESHWPHAVPREEGK